MTAAHLVDDVLPEVVLRQWVLTFPFHWRASLAHDGPLLSTLTQQFVETMSAQYTSRTGAFGDKDPITRGAYMILQAMIPGAADQPHAMLAGAGHFSQEDAGEEFAAHSCASGVAERQRPSIGQC